MRDAGARSVRLAYGGLGLPLAFAALPIYVHVPRFYAETVGMQLTLLGGLLMAARLLDALVDPGLGWLVDRMPRKRLLAWALLPLTLGFVALFHPSATHPLAWLAGALTLTYLGYSAATIALQAWGADLGRDATERTRLTGAREAFALLGVILAAALPSILGEELATGLARMSWIFPPLVLLAAVIAFAWVDDTAAVRCSSAMRQASSFTRAFDDVAFLRLLGVFALNGISAAVPATLFLFFVADVLQLAQWSGALLALYFLAGAISVPAWVALANRYGRARGWWLGMVLATVAFASAGLLGTGDGVPFAAICLLSGIALGADVSLPPAIAANLGERQGCPGAYFGWWNFIAKMNLAFAAGIALPLLGWMGYQPGNHDGHQVLVLAYAVIPLVFKMLAIVLLWRWQHLLEK